MVAGEEHCVLLYMVQKEKDRKNNKIKVKLLTD